MWAQYDFGGGPRIGGTAMILWLAWSRFRVVLPLADDGIDVAVACWVLKASRSGYYEWPDRPLSAATSRTPTRSTPS
jgi:hypothetical protein